MSQIPPVHRGLSSCKTAKLALLSVAQICYPVVSFWQLLRVCFAILNYLVLAETPLAFPNNIFKKQKDKFSKSIVILIPWEVGSSLKEKILVVPRSRNPKIPLRATSQLLYYLYNSQPHTPQFQKF